MVSARPPARAIFSRADLLKRCAFTTIGLVSSPSPSTLRPERSFFTRPSSTRRSGVISPSSALSAPRLTTAYSLRNRLVNPRFGTRRCSGIWPPSKPKYCLRPERDSCPLLPAVAVLPCPEPGPRPTRFGFLRDPFAGLRFDRSSLRGTIVLHDTHEVRNGVHHAAHRRVVGSYHTMARVAKAERPEDALLPEGASNAAPVLLDDDRPAGVPARSRSFPLRRGRRLRLGGVRPGLRGDRLRRDRGGPAGGALPCGTLLRNRRALLLRPPRTRPGRLPGARHRQPPDAT